MESTDWRTWMRPYGVPTLLLLGSLGFMLVVWDDPDIVWGLFVAPALAFLSGLVLRPAHAWVTPAAVAGLIEVVSLAAYALGLIEPDVLGLDFVVATLASVILAVALPQTFFVWAGRTIASGIPALLGRDKGPGASAA